MTGARVQAPVRAGRRVASPWTVVAQGAAMLAAAAAVVLAGALAAVALRIRFPHRVGAMIEPSRSAPDR